MPKSLPLIESEKLTLKEWLELIQPHPDERGYIIIDYQFPTDKICKEYLNSVKERPDLEVKLFMRRFLMETGGDFGSNERFRAFLGEDPKRLMDAVDKFEFVRRLITDRPTWEGCTWVLDLLPEHPQKAYDVLSAYLVAHSQFLPDGKAMGLCDALSIIRHRYFHYDHPVEHILSLTPYSFEKLIAELFSQMGYETTLTKRSRDGGYDVIAKGSKIGGKEHVLIECKRRQLRFGVAPIRQLGGVLESNRANKAFFISCGSYTKEASAFALKNKIELIGWEELNKLLNQYLGQSWPDRLEWFLNIGDIRSKMAQD